MRWIRLEKPLRINISGFDRQTTEYRAGDHQVPESVAVFVDENPGFRHVIDDQKPQPGTGDDDQQGGEERDDESAVDALERESRATLDAMAVEHGIGNPAALPNKRAVAEAIYAAATDVHDRDDE